MKQFFIIGTGTNVGKTVVTSALTWQLRNSGKKVAAMKPVISGFDNDHIAGSDTAELLTAMEMEINVPNAAHVSPWRLKAALSPDMAAAREHKIVSLESVLHYCTRTSLKGNDYVLVEGIGGVMSPLNETHTMIDWIEHIKFPVILVTGSYLGTISHTLTAIEALRARKVAIQAVVVSESPENPTTLDETIVSLKRFSGVEHFFALHRHPEQSQPWKNLPDLLPLLA